MKMNKIILGLLISVFSSSYAFATRYKSAHVESDYISQLSKNFHKYAGRFTRMEGVLKNSSPDSPVFDIVSEFSTLSEELADSSLHIYELTALRDSMINPDDKKTVEGLMELDIKYEMKTSKKDLDYMNNMLLSIRNVEIETEGEGLVHIIRKYRKYIGNQ